MRVVIYDDESLEPITVVSLPLTERALYQRGMRWRIPVPPSLPLYRTDEDESELDKPKIVEVWFEHFVRGKQRSMMCFTKATDLAMLLDSTWLPGQYGAVNRLKDDIAGLERLLAMVLR